MKGSNGGGSLLYVIVVCLAILLGCLASSAQCRSQLFKKVVRTRGVFLAGTAGNTSAYHSEIACPSVVAAGDDESKLTLIFCTVKCHCNGGDDLCYCCQKPPGPVCYEKLADCQANCAICQPECPPAPPVTATTGEGQHLDATTNATSNL